MRISIYTSIEIYRKHSTQIVSSRRFHSVLLLLRPSLLLFACPKSKPLNVHLPPLTHTHTCRRARPLTHTSRSGHFSSVCFTVAFLFFSCCVLVFASLFLGCVSLQRCMTQERGGWGGGVGGGVMATDNLESSTSLSLFMSSDFFLFCRRATFCPRCHCGTRCCGGLINLIHAGECLNAREEKDFAGSNVLCAKRRFHCRRESTSRQPRGGAAEQTHSRPREERMCWTVPLVRPRLHLPPASQNRTAESICLVLSPL